MKSIEIIITRYRTVHGRSSIRSPVNKLFVTIFGFPILQPYFFFSFRD
jgi:hypothetical protein